MHVTPGHLEILPLKTASFEGRLGSNGDNERVVPNMFWKVDDSRSSALDGFFYECKYESPGEEIMDVFEGDNKRVVPNKVWKFDESSIIVNPQAMKESDLLFRELCYGRNAY